MKKVVTSSFKSKTNPLHFPQGSEVIHVIKQIDENLISNQI